MWLLSLLIFIPTTKKSTVLAYHSYHVYCTSHFFRYVLLITAWHPFQYISSSLETTKLQAFTCPLKVWLAVQTNITVETWWQFYLIVIIQVLVEAQIQIAFFCAVEIFMKPIYYILVRTFLNTFVVVVQNDTMKWRKNSQ